MRPFACRGGDPTIPATQCWTPYWFLKRLEALEDKLNKCCDTQPAANDCNKDKCNASNCKDDVKRIVQALLEAREKIGRGGGPVTYHPFWAAGYVCNECDDIVNAAIRDALFGGKNDTKCFRARQREPAGEEFDHCSSELQGAGCTVTIDFWHDVTDFWAFGEDLYGYRPTY